MRIMVAVDQNVSRSTAAGHGGIGSFRRSEPLFIRGGRALYTVGYDDAGRGSPPAADRPVRPGDLYLRVSVTDRCDFRCVYCMAEDMTFLPKAEILSLEELDRLCSAFVRLGVRKLRLTGGEPLVRRNVMAWCGRCRAISAPAPSTN
jgi:sulfatase maturation enzyme AslB (radical SAM superfamily)